MVYAVSIEIILHLLEAALPPAEVILRHLIPVIGREAPVLTTDREVIGRSTGRSIEVEELRINSGIYAVRTDTDRYIALHRYADRVRISYCIRQLLVGMELQKLIKVFRLLVAFRQESGIRLQPTVVLCDKGLIFLAAKERIFVLLVQRLEEYHLCVIDVLIVRKSQRIEGRFLCLVFLLLRRRQTTHLLDIDIDRMKCKHAHSVIRIAIEVIMTQRRIIDRQRLDHLLPRSRSPVCHLLQVLELTDTEAFFATQREHRHGYTCTLPTRLGTTESTVVLIDDLTFLNAPNLTILAPFGIYYRTSLEVKNDVFIFYDILALHVDVCAPDRELSVAHDQLTCRIPFAECLAVSDDSHTLRRLDLRQVNRETDVTLRSLHFRRILTMEKRLQECRGIERVLIGAGLPCVAHYDAFVARLEH